MNPEGTGLAQLTKSVASDAHAVWTGDGRIFHSTPMFGFQQETPLDDDSMHPYTIIMIMDADGNNKTPLANSLWKDAMPMFAVRGYMLASTCSSLAPLGFHPHLHDQLVARFSNVDLKLVQNVGWFEFCMRYKLT